MRACYSVTEPLSWTFRFADVLRFVEVLHHYIGILRRSFSVTVHSVSSVQIADNHCNNANVAVRRIDVLINKQ